MGCSSGAGVANTRAFTERPTSSCDGGKRRNVVQQSKRIIDDQQPAASGPDRIMNSQLLRYCSADYVASILVSLGTRKPYGIKIRPQRQQKTNQSWAAQPYQSGSCAASHSIMVSKSR
eukprot:scaffold33529_cov116-Skeletonema_dohrnii-CCMP3373.AAC.1